jgi:hypothetical protein
MQSHSFRVETANFPLVTVNDELIIVHRDALSVDAALFVGCHADCEFEVRSAADRTAVETVTVPHTVGGTGSLTMPAGGKRRVDLPGAGAIPNDVVTKITVLSGRIYVSLASFGEHQVYFKQIDVPAI